MTSKKILALVQFALLAALEAIVCFTPLGSLPVGPVVATLSHIPVIFAAILLGPGAGSAMGLLFGVFSLYIMTTRPTVASFIFTPFYSEGVIQGNAWSLVICFVPRILIGTVSGYLFKAMQAARAAGVRAMSYAVSAVAGSLTNTFLVLGGVFLFFRDAFAQINGVANTLVLGLLGTVVLTNGIPEAVVAAVLASAVCLPLRRYVFKEKA